MNFNEEIKHATQSLQGRAKFRSWANFPWFFPKKIRYSKNDLPKSIG
jgi:hypothetical protein